MKNSGFTIFAIRGHTLPGPNENEHKMNCSPNQMYVPLEVIVKHWESNKARPLNFQGADEAELEAALKASMATWEKETKEEEGGAMVGTVFNAKGAKAPEAEKPGFTAFTGKGVRCKSSYGSTYTSPNRGLLVRPVPYPGFLNW